MIRARCCRHWLAILLIASSAGCATHHWPISDRTATAQDRAVAVVFQQGLTIRCVPDADDARSLIVEVAGLKPETLQLLRNAPAEQLAWPEIFSVFVDEPGNAATFDLPAIQGRYAIFEDRIRFEPQFPMRRGVGYRVLIQSGRIPGQGATNAVSIAVAFRLPAPPQIPKTIVQAIYPSADRLPENLLKFYIHFSAPMSRGGNYEHIHLLDAAGKPVELPFLEIGEELWNSELTRLTLLFDPGRIKRGVLPLEEIGPAIESGHRYTLLLDAKWQDGDGIPVKASFRKTFQVGPPDRTPPDIATWVVHPPEFGTRRPLEIRFAEPMDEALARRLIWVTDAAGHNITGQVTLSNEERRWRFVPEKVWATGRHQIVADTVLEDLAGNSLAKPFDVDVFERIEEKPSPKTVSISFEVSQR